MPSPQRTPLYLVYRRGKGAGTTVVEGLRLGAFEKEKLLKAFKARFGCGGTMKSGDLEIQGDRRDALEAEFRAKGYRVKRKGG